VTPGPIGVFRTFNKGAFTLMSNAIGKIDFHLHSYASNVTDYYAANAFAIPESHSEPLKLYPLLKERGMTLVTLTDHNSIDGAVEMLDAGLTDVFISAEMTTTFPEDGCNIHMTIANITQEQFKEANGLRRNIYEMVAYLDLQISEEERRASANKLIYFMTHPLMSTQNRPYGREGSLTLEHIEKTILLCNTFEIHNGARTRAVNDLTARLLTSLTPEIIDRLAAKHGIAPKGETPWLKAFVGGSDDHSGINPGKTWTVFEYQSGQTPANALVESIRRRQTRPEGAYGGPITLAHSLLKLLYDGSRKRSTSTNTKPMRVEGPIRSLLELVFEAEAESMIGRIRRKGGLLRQKVLDGWGSRVDGLGVPFERVLGAEVGRLLSSSEFRAALAATESTDARIFMVISTLVNRIFAHYVSNLKKDCGLNLVDGIKEFVALISSNLFVSMPYLVSFLQQASDCLVARDVREAFQFRQQTKVALLTDTFFEINGVSGTIKRMIGEAVRRDIDFTVITCLSSEEQEKYCAEPDVRRFLELGRLRILTSVANLDFPEYEGLQIRFPPLLELLKYLQEEGFTKVQISTPGTIGLAGLLAGKILQIETAATYHTNIPEYVENYTRDVSLEALAWKYMILFYHSVDEVVVPSRSTGKLLHKRGLRKRKILLLDRWVDVERFHPRNRTPGYWKKYGIDNEEALVKFIYVGRIGVEKNLQLIASAYRKLRETRPDAHLIFIGEGPYRRDLEKEMSGVPVTFTGVLEGVELARAIASGDVKLFPSTTDTWGNAPLEAQASGLPVVVSDVGGPPELMLEGLTGLKVKGRDVQGLYDAMVSLMDEPTRVRMGRMARTFAEANRVEEPFTAILDSEAHRRRLRENAMSHNALQLTNEMLDLSELNLEFEDALH
jgi:glycosyltransferase involved in cell wall biosynthesis